MKKLVLATIIAASSTGAMANVRTSHAIDIKDVYKVPETCTLKETSVGNDDDAFGETKSFSIETNVANGKAKYKFSGLTSNLAGVTSLTAKNGSPIAENKDFAINNNGKIEFKFANNSALLNNEKFLAGDYEAKVTVTAKCIK